MFNILKNVPMWVYPLFMYLIIKGIKTLKPRVINLHQIFIFPVISICLNLQNHFSNPNLFFTSFWALFFLVGATLSWALSNKTIILADKKKKLIQLPGGFTTFILIISVFTVKFFISFKVGMNPDLANNFTFCVVRAISTGIISGAFCGKAFCYFKKYNKATHNELLISNS